MLQTVGPFTRSRSFHFHFQGKQQCDAVFIMECDPQRRNTAKDNGGWAPSYTVPYRILRRQILAGFSVHFENLCDFLIFAFLGYIFGSVLK